MGSGPKAQTCMGQAPNVRWQDRRGGRGLQPLLSWAYDADYQ